MLINNKKENQSIQKKQMRITIRESSSSNSKSKNDSNIYYLLMSTYQQNHYIFNRPGFYKKNNWLTQIGFVFLSIVLDRGYMRLSEQIASKQFTIFNALDIGFLIIAVLIIFIGLNSK